MRLIVDNLLSLGGRLRLGTKVERILVESGAATGVQLAGGETIAADWVISAADGHATIYDLLGGKYTDKVTDKIYRTLKTFPSYLQVSLGIARDLSQQAGYVMRLLDAPLMVDPGTQLRQVSFRFFHFDPTSRHPERLRSFAFCPTYNFQFWVDLRQRDPVQYHAEKHRVAEAVIAILERSVADIRPAIEVIDVSTPATVIRYTGNWKGSMEGWLLTPGTGFRPLPENPTGFAAVLDGGSMGHAGRRAAIGSDDGTIRYSSGVQARAGAVRGSTGCFDLRRRHPKLLAAVIAPSIWFVASLDGSCSSPTDNRGTVRQSGPSSAQVESCPTYGIALRRTCSRKMSRTRSTKSLRTIRHAHQALPCDAIDPTAAMPQIDGQNVTRRT